jgi:hypothetical protein
MYAHPQKGLQCYPSTALLLSAKPVWSEKISQQEWLEIVDGTMCSAAQQTALAFRRPWRSAYGKHVATAYLPKLQTEPTRSFARVVLPDRSLIPGPRS